MSKTNPFTKQTLNAFCPTGKGGGVDPTCSPSKSSSVGSCPQPCHDPDPHADPNGDGITDAARVGVPGDQVPPPPKIGRVPNLNEREREVEGKFIDAYEKDPDGVADNFREVVSKSTKPGEPKVFGTDDAKILTDAWGGDDLQQRSENRAKLNVALHQTANAVAKRAFVRELDTLKPGDEVMVTVGGCGAGKGFALNNVPQALEVKGRSKIVWDSAGDQNATENPWVLREASKRGLKVNYVYVNADPKVQWGHPERGVIKRAGDPKDGRMVDAQVFADSYAIGAKNHNAFYQANKNTSNANFVFLDNSSGPPKLLDGVPKEALSLDSTKLAKFAVGFVQTSSAPDHVKEGGTIGGRIWP